MSKSGFYAAIKSVFIASSSSKAQETVRTGLIFGFIIASLSLLLLMTGVYNEVDTYVNTMVMQMAIEDKEEMHPRICIVKKDQATSELLEKNPDRAEFASLFRFLGQPQIIQRPHGGAGRGLRVLDIGIGCFTDLKDLPFKTGYDEWGSFADFSDQASATHIEKFDQRNWHSSSRRVRDYFKANPDAETFSGLIQVRSYLWNPLAKNAFTALAGGGQYLVLPTLATRWDDPELKKYLQNLSDKNNSTDNAPPAGIAESIELLNRWQNLFDNLNRIDVDLHIVMFEKPGVLLSISLDLVVDPPTPEYIIEPASVIGFDFVLQGEKSDAVDNALVAAIESTESQVVLAAHTALEEDARDYSQESKTGDDAFALGRKASAVMRHIMPHEKFIKGNAMTAVIDIALGSKSFVTMVPMFIANHQEKRLIPSFSLKIAMLELDRCHPELKPSYSEEMNRVLAAIYDDVASGKFRGPLTIHDRSIPVDSRGMMLIDFYGSTSVGRYRWPRVGSVSLYECLDEKTLRRLLKKMPEKNELDPIKAHSRTLYGGMNSFNKSERIMLVGPFEITDFDYFPTPMELYTPYRAQKEQLMGIEIHANAIINILDKLYIKHPNGYHTAFALFVSCILLGFILDILTPVAGFFLVVAFMGGAFWHSFNSYHYARQMFNSSALLFSYPAIWAIATLTNYVRQRARAQKTKDMFSRFVAADVVQYMLDNPDIVKPGGEKVELTIFFSDVAGFTSISEALTPEELVVLLNEYLGAMTDLLFEYGGTLDKFIGDAVMAFWNFPRKQDDHAVRACLCALAMQRKINELQIGWAERGLPRVSARAGLNTANVVVGYMGSSKAQMNFTCMGDGVNLASRLEGANKEYGTAMMVSDATFQRAKHAVVGRFLDFLAVKGKKEPVKVHELVCEVGKEPPGWNELIELYNRAIQLHLERKWDEAIATFEQILARWPDDGPSRTYIARCNEYKENPPPEGWDGRYILTHK